MKRAGRRVDAGGGDVRRFPPHRVLRRDPAGVPRHDAAVAGLQHGILDLFDARGRPLPSGAARTARRGHIRREEVIDIEVPYVARKNRGIHNVTGRFRKDYLDPGTLPKHN